MSDLISRQDAIDAIDKALSRTFVEPCGEMILKDVPPAQPEHDENDLDFVQTHKRIPVQLVVSSDCISRQAAIEINQSYHGQMPNEVNYRIWKEINELPSAQLDTPTDCVSREKAIDIVAPYDEGREMQDALEDLQSVEPEREKGKWIVYYECPECGEITKDFTEYCPFCNADMRGERDG